jgi:hypothetical protein
MTARRLVFAICTAAALSAGDAQAQSRGVYWRVDTGYDWAADAELKDKNSSSFGYLDSGKIETNAGNVTGFFAQPYDGATGYLRTQGLQVGLRF